MSPKESRLDALRAYENEHTPTSPVTANFTLGQLDRFPEEIRGRADLTVIQVYDQGISEIPDWIGDFASLRILVINANEISDLPSTLSRLTSLESLFLGRGLGGNPLRTVPPVVLELANLTWLGLNECQLEDVPVDIFKMPNLEKLDLSENNLSRLPFNLPENRVLRELSIGGNQIHEWPIRWDLPELRAIELDDCGLTQVPEFLRTLKNLERLSISHNNISETPWWLEELPNLRELDVSGNQTIHISFNSSSLQVLKAASIGSDQFPASILQKSNLRRLDLSSSRLTAIPAEISDLAKLEELDLDDNLIEALPDSIGQIQNLRKLSAASNLLQTLPASLAHLTGLAALELEGNPLAPELAAAAEDGTAELMSLLELLDEEGEEIREAKLVLVGEGEVGKSSLLAALRDEPWMPDRDTTHGIEIKRVQLQVGEHVVNLNGWDFGGQRVYRPTHQIFFTDPAVYLVVWKPREGPELGLVEYWIRTIRQRAGAAARIHVVATHGGPSERYAHIDQTLLISRFPGNLHGFHHVDSQSGYGIDDLRHALAETVSELPHVRRYYPTSWIRLRNMLSTSGAASISYSEYESIAETAGLTQKSALSLATNSHALGHWVYYSDDPTLAELIVLKADWLSVAIGFVLEDSETIAADGVLPHRRLSQIWNDSRRALEHRYPTGIHQVFLRLMERFELSYRLPESRSVDEPKSLISQLVPADRPDLAEAWEAFKPLADQTSFTLRLLEWGTDVATAPEGLIYRLIVIFHRFGLGRLRRGLNVHWQGGMILQDRYESRALILLSSQGVSVHVRGPYPQSFANYLVTEIQASVEDYWRGLKTQTMVPCREGCGLGTPGTALFDVEKLLSRRARGKSDYPCPVLGCDMDVAIDELLLGTSNLAKSVPVELDELVRGAVSETLRPNLQEILSRLDEIDDATNAAFSREDERLRLILASIEDEGARGPRLFSIESVGRTVMKPGWTSTYVKIRLWCEHSRIPVYLLDNDESSGVYEIKVSREWWVKAAPYVRLTSVILKSLLPVSIAAVELDLSKSQWDSVNEEVKVMKEGLGGVTDLGQRANAQDSHFAQNGGSDDLPILAEGGTLRMLHKLLEQEDETFADLRRVRGHDGKFIWVHPRFVHIYNPPLPEIPPV